MQRYWVTETVQTFNEQNVRVYRKETTHTFDSLVEAAGHIYMLQEQPPVVVGGGRCTQNIVLEGQEYNKPIPPADACHEAVPHAIDRRYMPRGFA